MLPRNHWDVRYLEIPEQVSGHPVSRLGVHLQAHGFHGPLCENPDYWTELLRSMGMSWVVMLTESNSAVMRNPETGLIPAKVLLDRGIIPILREKGEFPHGFTDHDAVRQSVDLYGQYGLRPFWIIRNEPFDGREWDDDWLRRHKPTRKQKWDIILEVVGEGMQAVINLGGYAGFPDGPCYGEDPFALMAERDMLGIWHSGKAFYAAHCYGKNRHRDYPYDAVTRYGHQLTEADYERVLDDYAEDAAWHDAPVELLNEERRRGADSTASALLDDTCFRGWEKIVLRAERALGYVPPIAITEGGWVPRDRAGTGPNTDIRHPHTTPKMVGKKTRQMFHGPSPLFGICPWLLADSDLGGSGWPFDAWHGWAYSEKYGSRKPVIDDLQQFEPNEIMIVDIEGDIRDPEWMYDNFDFIGPRESGNVRLVEIHEYVGGPPPSHAWVDPNGLPLPNNDSWPLILTEQEPGERYLYGIFVVSGEPEPPEEAAGWRRVLSEYRRLIALLKQS